MRRFSALLALAFAGCGFRDDLRLPDGLLVEQVTLGQPDAVQGEAGIPLTVRVRNVSSVREEVGLPSILATIGGVDRSADFTPSPGPGNPSFVPPGGTADFQFTLAVNVATPGGVASLNARVSSADGVVQSEPAPAAASLLVLRHAQLEITSQTLDGATCRDSRVALFRVHVRNTGESVAELDDALPVILRGTADVTPEFTVTPVAGNATTVGPGAEIDLDYTIASSAATALGLVTADLPVSGADARGGADATPLAPGVPSALVVHEPAALSLIAITETPVTVSKGQTGIAVQASLANAGSVPAALTAGSLTFAIGGTNTTGDYTVPAATLGTIGSAGTLNVDFTVAVGAAAMSGATVIDATFGASDLVCAETPSATNALAKGAWTVQTPPILAAAVAVNVTNVWAGDSGMVTLTITNSGEATANAVAPSLSISSCPSCVALTAVDTAAKTIPAGMDATYTWTAVFSVPVAGDVETPGFDGSGAGSDANTGGAVTSSGGTDSAVVEARLPTPCFTFTPAATSKSAAGTDVFSVDASCSSDIESPDAALDFDWDWSDDGTFDTNNAMATTHNYGSAGRKRAVVRVTDPQGRRAYKTRILVVETNSDYGCVTTPIDELDANDITSNGNIAPYDGTGWSFREAVEWTGPHGGQGTICISAALAGQTITFNPALGDFRVLDNDTIIVGRPDVVLDISGVRGIVTNFDTEIYDLRITGGTGPKIILSDDDVIIRGCELFGGTGPGIAWVQGLSELTLFDNHILYNDIHDNPGGGIVINPADGDSVEEIEIVFNRVYDNGTVGIFVRADDLLVIGRNLVYGNTGHGIHAELDDSDIVNNTIALNTGDGIRLDFATTSGDATGADYWNNLLSDNAGYGLNVAAGVGADSFGDNFVFGNDLGETLGLAGDLGTDPSDELGTVDPMLEPDFELAQSSPCRNIGLDNANTPDSNDTETGKFHGSGQDVGAWESPR